MAEITIMIQHDFVKNKHNEVLAYFFKDNEKIVLSKKTYSGKNKIKQLQKLYSKLYAFNHG